MAECVIRKTSVCGHMGTRGLRNLRKPVYLILIPSCAAKGVGRTRGFSPLPNAKAPAGGALVHPAGILRGKPSCAAKGVGRTRGFSPLPNAKAPARGALVHPAGIEPTTFSVGG